MAVSVFLTSLTIALVIGVDPHKTLTAADLWRFGLGISVTAPALICPAVSLRTAKVLQRMRKAHAELVDLAEKDTLTGLLNRRGFDAAAASVLAEARRLSQPITALMCDIDMFKDINDKYGHDFGDVALVGVAQVIRASIGDRAAVLGRQGGDEFAILLPRVDSEEAANIAQALRETCEAHACAQQDSAGRITLSVGTATDSSGEAKLQTLLSRADAALYQAKRGGRNLIAPMPQHRRVAGRRGSQFAGAV